MARYTIYIKIDRELNGKQEELSRYTLRVWKTRLGKWAYQWFQDCISPSPFPHTYLSHKLRSLGISRFFKYEVLGHISEWESK